METKNHDKWLKPYCFKLKKLKLKKRDNIYFRITHIMSCMSCIY